MPRFPVAALVGLAVMVGCGTAPDEPPPGAAAPRAASPREAPAETPAGEPERDESDPEAAGFGSAEPPAPAAESPPPRPAAKTWKDAAGQVLATGEFIDLIDGNVCIQKPDGLGTTVPWAHLCPADQEYVRARTGASRATEPAGGEPGTPSAGERSVPEAAGQVASAVSAVPPQLPAPPASTSRRKVVIPFDFQSRFDEGEYGRRIGDMVWKKIDREGGFILPDSMADVRDLLAANGLSIGPDTPLAEVRRVVRDYFQADIGVWGSVERAPGHEWDVYDLVIRCVDFSYEPEPRVIYEKTGVRTNTVSEIPHRYIQQMLDALYQRAAPGPAPGPAPVDQLAEENWKNNPNLIVGGDFQKGSGGVPTGWEPRGGQPREPLGRLVQWTTESGNPGNRVIRFTFDKAVGDSTGVMYYSDWFPIQEGATYRFQCRYRTNGPSPKVFVKCYAEMPSEYAAEGASRPAPGRYVPESLQRREVYRSQQNLKGPKNTWNVQTEDFTPKHTKYSPQWGKVMLYAYLGGGVVEWDDVVVKQIIPASPSETKKTPRHSLESPVTIEQMRENERRGREARQRLREQPE